VKQSFHKLGSNLAPAKPVHECLQHEGSLVEITKFINLKRLSEVSRVRRMLGLEIVVIKELGRGAGAAGH
jgi:diphthamide synthase subunit DPH2